MCSFVPVGVVNLLLNVVFSVLTCFRGGGGGWSKEVYKYNI